MNCVKLDLHTSAAGHKIGIVKIARPEAMNALNKQVLSELREVLASLRDLRCAILTGDGEKAFVAGADIKEFESLNAHQAKELAINGQALLQQMEDLPLPIVAAINGFALGGGLEVALACDFMLASNKARWGLPEVTLGLIPGYGGTQRLSRVLGRALARRVALSGEMFTAQQGYDWGLFTQLCEPVELLPTAVKLGETLASRAPRALALAKQAINQGHDLSLRDGLKLEADLFAKTFETADHVEGIKAFVEKRSPQFRGN